MARASKLNLLLIGLLLVAGVGLGLWLQSRDPTLVYTRAKTDLPLIIIAEDKELKFAAMMAVDWWSGQLGRPVAVVAVEGPDVVVEGKGIKGVISLRWADIMGEIALGHTRWTLRDEVIVASPIAVDRRLSTKLALVVAHELGHALGLGDDREGYNIMAYSLRGLGWRVTEQDLAALREAYARH